MTTTESAPAATPDEVVTDTAEPEPRRRNRVLAAVGDLLRRYWGTAFLLACVLIAGVSTGALWREVAEGSALYDDVAYGLPALQDGRWWTFLTGMFFAPALILYVPILLLLVLVATTYERRVGHVRTIVVAIGGQFLAGLLTALFLWIFDESGWTWAREARGRA